MLYYLCSLLRDGLGPLRVFQYPSFRVPAAALSALVLTLWLFPRCIALLRQRQGGRTEVREDTPAAHQKKRGTPTMGGLIILLVVAICTGLWADLSNLYVWTLLGVLVGFGAIGFSDDYLKITKKNSRGLPGKQKLAWQLVVLAALTGFLVLAQSSWWPAAHLSIDTRLSLPFVAVRWFHPDLGWAYVPFAWLVIMGTSHAVNLTDGLDGLAIGPVIVSSATFLLLAYLAGLVLSFNANGTWVDFNVADYLNMPHIEGSS